MTEKKAHWENVYQNKTPDQVSWTQKIPQVSIDFITSLTSNYGAPIIDIGGGDSNLVDFLLDLGYSDLTVLDISEAAIERAKKRLGEKGQQVHWIVADVLDFVPERKYEVWHDRAAFHFLTSEEDRNIYKNRLIESKAEHLVIGTFSKSGPMKCSGLEIYQYEPKDLADFLTPEFRMKGQLNRDHLTPFDTVQNFTFGCFEKLGSL